MKGPNIVISAGQTESESFASEIISNASMLFIYAPSSQSGQVKVVIAPSASSTHVPLQSPAGTDLVLFAGKAVGIMIQRGVGSMKLRTTVAPIADETYQTTIGGL